MRVFRLQHSAKKRQLRERERAAERYELYLESKQAKNYDWENAFFCCTQNVKYINKHSRSFKNRYKPARICLLLLMFLATIAISFVAVYFGLGWETTTDHFTVVCIIAALLIILECYLLSDYDHTVSYNLKHSAARVKAFSEVWPDIVDLVEDSLDGKISGLPEEPERVAQVVERKTEPLKIKFCNVDTNEKSVYITIDT